MRMTRFLSFVIATAFASIAMAAGPVPAGWVEEEAGGNVQRVLRHGESQAGIEVSRLQLGAESVERFQRNLKTKLAADGIELESPATPETFGSLTGTVTRYTKTVLEVQFTILVVDVHHKNSLLHVVAWLRPTEEISEEALEKDVLSFVTSLVK
jgi:hypothetical protein